MQPFNTVSRRISSHSVISSALRCSIHSSAVHAANVAPIVGTGPPPEAPIPATPSANERVARRRKQAELLKTAKDIRSAKDGKSVSLKTRFWKDVSVKEVDGRL